MITVMMHSSNNVIYRACHGRGIDKPPTTAVPHAHSGFLIKGSICYLKMVRDPCNLYTKEPFPQSHAGEQYTVSSRRSLSRSLCYLNAGRGTDKPPLSAVPHAHIAGSLLRGLLATLLQEGH